MDVKRFLGMLNWKVWLIKIGIVLAILVGTSYISYEKGRANCRVAVAEQATKEAESRTVLMMETVEKRVPVIQYIEKDNAKLEAEVVSTKRKLDEAIKAAGVKPECSLSDAERLQFNEAAKAINRAATLPKLSDSR